MNSILHIFYSIGVGLAVIIGVGYWFNRRKKLTDVLNLRIGNGQLLGARKHQEDSFATVRTNQGALLVVADGMGELESGKKASKLAVKTFRERFVQAYDLEPIKFLINTSYISNQRILDLAADKEIGTTLVAAVIKENLLYWISIGDSRIFLYQNQKLKALNNKHILANKLKKDYQDDKIGRYEALNYPKRDRLFSYLGQDDFHQLNYSKTPIKLSSEDKVVLCTDGIEDNLSEHELKKICAKNQSPGGLAQLTVNKLKKKEIPHQDNATIVAAEYETSNAGDA